MATKFEGVVIDSAECLPTEEEVNESPWKYIGYRDFTAYVASDPDFFAVRRFDRLHTRAILTLQDQLVHLEESLDSLDDKYGSKNIKAYGANPVKVVDIRDERVAHEEWKTSLRDINNGSARDDMPERARLISDITQKLAQYDKVLLDYSSLRSLGPAPTRNVRNLEVWFNDNSGAIMEKETKFIHHRDELTSVFRTKSALRQWFEEHVVYRTRKIFALFCKRPDAFLKTRDRKDIYVVKDEAIDLVGSVAIFVAAATMLIAPLWVLQALEGLKWKLATITAFTFVCLAFLSVATLGRPFERLAATAGYLAVLVVFLQFGSSA